MTQYRNNLPQLSGDLFITDGGMETTLIFHEGWELPEFASFGKLPTGQSLKEAIDRVDAETGNAPAYYAINCAHPTHFADVLTAGEAWVSRIRGIRANSSQRSHAELNEAPDLDEGNPTELGQQYRELREKFPNFNILGGCCGTDDRHIEAICKACLPVAWTYYSNLLHL
jgi:S-methylmethionine-dependent homocysteine/selenocysteine methylase